MTVLNAKTALQLSDFDVFLLSGKKQKTYLKNGKICI